MAEPAVIQVLSEQPVIAAQPARRGVRLGQGAPGMETKGGDDLVHTSQLPKNEYKAGRRVHARKMGVMSLWPKHKLLGFP